MQLRTPIEEPIAQLELTSWTHDGTTKVVYAVMVWPPPQI